MEYIRIYETKVPNARITLDRQVELENIYQQISDSALKEKFYELLAYKSLNFWDFGVRASKNLKKGMSVSIICETIKYDGVLLDIIEDPRGEIGDLLGWARQFGEPWKNVCALEIVKREAISYSVISELKNKSKSIYSNFLEVTDPDLLKQTFSEGKQLDIILTKYERSIAARRACIAHHGPTCEICDFDFYSTYGELGQGYIHVHHKIPLSEIRVNYHVDPIKDLIPVCPNCHAMLHSKHSETISVEKLKEIYKMSNQ